MPYESKAQAAYMHIHHPEITAKWKEEGHGYVKTKKRKGKMKKLQHVEKSKREWAAGLGVATAGGALANQVPPIQEVARKRKKKGKVAKADYESRVYTDDPEFNHRAARKVFDLVMKMDDETAQMFCHVTASDLLEQEIEKNLSTLQRHLDQVVGHRLEAVKKAVMRTVHKGTDGDPVGYAQALEVVEGLIQKDDIPNWQFERKIVRDPSSGRFRTKITQTRNDKPFDRKTAKAMGIGHTEDEAYKNLKKEDKARYQNEYMQLTRFLDAVTASTGKGNNDIMLHFKDRNTNETWVEQAGERPPKGLMLDPNTQLVAAEARPNTLTAGGAAFSLAGAMGGQQMTAAQIRAINSFDEKYKAGGFSESWMGAGEDKYQNTNARLYGRTKTLGEVASMAPEGSKLQLAGKMAEIVGNYGPQAEEVLGPSARKTAYRYRGTERTPDKRLVRMYEEGIRENKRIGPMDLWGAKEEAKFRTPGQPRQPYGSPTGVRAKGTYQRKPEAPTTPAVMQMVAQGEAAAERAPDWQERELGRSKVQNYLMARLPKKSYYKLHLEAGNTPPSEGVIINADGQIQTQASGYGDDHYLPFNLKNLKGLKGGEYIRSRSVGGLTSEDIYTGLISGARRVTVVSRSGTFTMEFQPDFRGGRRHNDKARRMTRRYEHILDAVQSEQVDRKDVPKVWKDVIAQEVRDEYGQGASSSMLRQEIDARITEFKENPKIEGRDMDRAEAAISRFERDQATGRVSAQDVADYRKEILSELRDMKEVRFRLNGVGYAAALDSLEEQFPYYIHSMSRPKEEHLEEFEIDRGYVEPSRNRPTGAKAGWHGTEGKESSMKYSAAHADYQRGAPGAPEPGRQPKSKGSRTTESQAATTTTPRAGQLSERQKAADRAEEVYEESRAKVKQKEAALALHRQARTKPAPVQPGGGSPEWWGLDDDGFRSWIDQPGNLAKFDNMVTQTPAATWAQTAPSEHLQYQNARGAVSSKAYSPEVGPIWTQTPYKFKNAGEAFRPNPNAGVVQAQMKQIDGKSRSLLYDKPLSELTEKQMEDEVTEIALVLRSMDDMKRENPGVSSKLLQATYSKHFASPGSGHVNDFFTKKDGPNQHLENLHKMRYLKRNPGTGQPPAQASGGGSPAPPSSPPTPTPAPVPATPAAPAASAAVAAPVSAVPAGPTPEEKKAARELAESERKERNQLVAGRRKEFIQAAERVRRRAEADGDHTKAGKLKNFVESVRLISAGTPDELLDQLNVLQKQDPDLFQRVQFELPRKAKQPRVIAKGWLSPL